MKQSSKSRLRPFGIFLVIVLVVAYLCWNETLAEWFGVSVNVQLSNIECITLSTSLIAVWAAVESVFAVVNQSKLMDQHRDRDFIQSTLGYALDDFRARAQSAPQLEDCNDTSSVFLCLLKMTLKAEQPPKENIYVCYRIANHTIKPIAYWCRSVAYLESSREDYILHEMRSSAYRILATVPSACFVYLYAATKMALEYQEIGNDEFSRVLNAHKDVWQFLVRNVQSEVNETLSMNAGQVKMIDKRLKELGEGDMSRAAARLFS